MTVAAPTSKQSEPTRAMGTPERRIVRACMISYYFYPSYSGSAVQAHNLSRQLKRSGVEVFIVCANLTNSAAVETLDGICVYRLAVARSPSIRLLSFWVSLAWFLIRRRKSIDIVHAHGALPHGIASVMGRLLHKKSVLKIALANSDIAFERQGRLWGRLSKYFFKRYDRYVATSKEAFQECLSKGVDPNLVRLIPNGVDTTVFRPCDGAADRVALRREVGLPEGPLVCFVGIIDPRKNVDGVLRVWRDVQYRARVGHLVLIGPAVHDECGQPNAFFRRMQAFIADHGLTDSVTFTDQRPDVSLCLRCADIFFFPSRREGMPNVLLEAMASALPCVVSNIGGSADLVLQNRTGYVHDLADEAGMAASLVNLLEHPHHAARLGRASRERVQEVFSLEAVARMYEGLYGELLDSYK